MTKNDHEKKAEKHSAHSEHQHPHHAEAHHHAPEHHHTHEHHAGGEHHSAEHHLIHREVKPHAESSSPQAGDGATAFELPKGEEKIIDVYSIFDGPLEARVTIKNSAAHLKTYSLETPQLEEGTSVFLDDIKAALLKKITISTQEVLNIRMADSLKLRFYEMSKSMVRESMPQMDEHSLESISQRLVQDMLGLGNIEYLLHDDQIEEICVNGGGLPVWVYHKKHAWLCTDIMMESDSQIWNYASAISRGVGRQINTQTPLLDAYLSTGDRVNSTLFPISYFGNTITIRKFARKPWTITDYIKAKTISSEVAALLWLATQYEMNVIVSGGTGAGKTSLLNVLSMFIPPNQRIVSIEQTREINLPSHMQWVPLVVREPTSEGTGGVSMLDLMVNTLRMRPDRMIVGEIRRAEEAQVLFEAMHTGHSVYATLHAETVSETVKRLTNPPINIPSVMMESLHLVVAMFRDRRSGKRRVYEVGEIIPTDREGVEDSVIYRWRPYTDEIVAAEQGVRLMENLRAYTNMREEDIAADLADKQLVIDWMVKNNINTVEGVGDIMSSYYDDPQVVLKAAGKK